jgi:hypothetical protein
MSEKPAVSASWRRSVSSKPIIGPSEGAAASNTALTLAARWAMGAASNPKRVSWLRVVYRRLIGSNSDTRPPGLSTR